MQPEGKLAFEHIALLKCPDCAGKLLRGPRGGTLNQNLTCGDCHMRFNVTVVDNRTFTGMSNLPQSDSEFREHVAVVAFERLGQDDAGAAFYDPACAPQNCAYEPCGEEFTGPGLYCCLCCAISDA